MCLRKALWWVRLLGGSMVSFCIFVCVFGTGECSLLLLFSLSAVVCDVGTWLCGWGAANCCGAGPGVSTLLHPLPAADAPLDCLQISTTKNTTDGNTLIHAPYRPARAGLWDIDSGEWPSVLGQGPDRFTEWPSQFTFPPSRAQNFPSPHNIISPDG